MQVYAPPPEDEEGGAENEEAFHRTIFLFISPEGSKLVEPGAVKALRCQLPRKNDFYGFDPAPDSERIPSSVLVRSYSLGTIAHGGAGEVCGQRARGSRFAGGLTW